MICQNKSHSQEQCFENKQVTYSNYSINSYYNNKKNKIDDINYVSYRNSSIIPNYIISLLDLLIAGNLKISIDDSLREFKIKEEIIYFFDYISRSEKFSNKINVSYLTLDNIEDNRDLDTSYSLFLDLLFTYFNLFISHLEIQDCNISGIVDILIKHSIPIKRLFIKTDKLNNEDLDSLRKINNNLFSVEITIKTQHTNINIDDIDDSNNKKFNLINNISNSLHSLSEIKNKNYFHNLEISYINLPLMLNPISSSQPQKRIDNSKIKDDNIISFDTYYKAYSSLNLLIFTENINNKLLKINSDCLYLNDYFQYIIDSNKTITLKYTRINITVTNKIKKVIDAIKQAVSKNLILISKFINIDLQDKNIESISLLFDIIEIILRSKEYYYIPIIININYKAMSSIYIKRLLRKYEGCIMIREA